MFEKRVDDGGFELLNGMFDISSLKLHKDFGPRRSGRIDLNKNKFIAPQGFCTSDDITIDCIDGRQTCRIQYELILLPFLTGT